MMMHSIRISSHKANCFMKKEEEEVENPKVISYIYFRDRFQILAQMVTMSACVAYKKMYI